MKFTRRRGGPMVTLRARHDLLPYHVTAILCRFGDRLRGGAGPDDNGQPSRAQVETLVREMLAEYGRQGYLSEDRWDEDMPEADARARAAWAVPVVRRLYPEAAADDGQLADFAAEFGL